MRCTVRTTVSLPPPEVWSVVHTGASALMWARVGNDQLEDWLETKLVSNAKARFVQRTRRREHTWYVTVLLAAGPKMLDVAFDRGDLRLIVRHRLEPTPAGGSRWRIAVDLDAVDLRALPRVALMLPGIYRRLERRSRHVVAALERRAYRALGEGVMVEAEAG